MAKKKKTNKGRRKNAARPERTTQDATRVEEKNPNDAGQLELAQVIRSSMSSPDYVPDPNLVRGLVTKGTPYSVIESAVNEIMEGVGDGGKQILASVAESALNNPKAEPTEKQALVQVLNSAMNHPSGMPVSDFVKMAEAKGLPSSLVQLAVKTLMEQGAASKKEELASEEKEAAVAQVPPKQKPPVEDAPVACVPPKPKPIHQKARVQAPLPVPQFVWITAEFSGRLGIHGHLCARIPNEAIFSSNSVTDIRGNWYYNLMDHFSRFIQVAMPETKHPERILPILSALPITIKGIDRRNIPVQGLGTLKKFTETLRPSTPSATKSLVGFTFGGWGLTIPNNFEVANFDEVSLSEDSCNCEKYVPKWKATLDTPDGIKFQQCFEPLVQRLNHPASMLPAITSLAGCLEVYVKNHPCHLSFVTSLLQAFHPDILFAMEKQPYDFQIQQQGCIALRGLAQWQSSGESDNSFTLETVGLVATILARVSKNTKNAVNVIMEACHALEAMASDPTPTTNVVPDKMTTYMTKTSGVSCLLRAMDDYMEHEDFLVLACRTLTKLTLDAHVTLMYFWRVGGIETITLAMVRYPNNEELQEHACRVLERLTRWEELRVLESLSLENGVNILLAAIDNFPRNKKILSFGGATIFRLKDWESGRLSRPSLRDID